VSGLRGLAALGLDAGLAKPEDEAEVGSDVAREVGRRIAQARIAAGLSGTQFGAALGLAKDQVSKIENGRRKIDIGELARAARALGVSVGALLGQPERPQMALASRIAAGASSEDARPVHLRARQLLELDDLLTKAVGLPPAKPSETGKSVIAEARSLAQEQPRGIRAAEGQGRDIAASARKYLDLGGSRLADVAGIFEQNFGVDVALGPWGTLVDGLCVHSGEVALLMASTSFSEGHLRFTLCHELAHHLFGDLREVIDEGTDANAFAAHLLMPETGMRSVLASLGETPGQVSERSAVYLMEYFGVSLSSLTYHLKTMNWLRFEDGKRLRDKSAGSLVSMHPDAAPTGAFISPSNALRPPARLIQHALDAARSQQLGLSVVAILLDREDDDDLWKLVMGAGQEDTNDHVDVLTDELIR
jgi:transcriptional regulator with XRE-family HTH domain